MNSPQLLVIDHDPVVQHAVETALKPQGFAVTAVGDGLSALDVALAAPPDVILADYRMEGMNIFRFFEKLKHKHASKPIALLLLVNPDEVYDELTLRLVGVSDFLRKPLDPRDLGERVKRYAPIPASVPSAAPSVVGSESHPENIEDLLGWSQPSGTSPFSELAQEQPAGIDLSLDVPAGPFGATDDDPFHDRNEVTPTDFLVSPPDQAGQAVDRTIPVETERSANGLSKPPAELVDRLAHDVVEKVAWDVVPGLAQQSLEPIIKAIVERVVWETVPAIAETIIQQEIERLKSDNG